MADKHISGVLALSIVDSLRPSFTRYWADLIDGEVGAGEYVVAASDALQSAALAGYVVEPSVAEKIERLVVDPRTDGSDRVRLIHFLDQIRARA